MDDILFLAHRIPYPPNKGDKIRSWHILEHLAQRYRVHLGCFVDAPEDWNYAPFLKGLCVSTHFAPLRPAAARLRSLAGFVTGQPLSVAYYRNRTMRKWLRETVARTTPKAAFLYSSQMAAYLDDIRQGVPRIIMDFVDVDSDKWAQYAATRQPPMAWIYRREANLLAGFEVDAAEKTDASFFVSAQEVDLFRSRAPAVAEKIHAMNNGVDHAHFSPEGTYHNPFPDDVRPIVMTGAMDYWPNADAAAWFATEVLELVRKAVPNACFYVVGWKPGAAVKALANRPGIAVTGAVSDVRDYLAHAAVIVAPLRIARGIQNKVLEGMAMAKPVIASPQAAEGIVFAGNELAVAPSAETMARQVIEVLKDGPNTPDGQAARQRIVNDYGWQANLLVLDDLLNG